MTVVPNYANYDGLRLQLRPQQPGPGTYELVIENVGTLDLWHLQLELGEVIGPGAYGLDDTHMGMAPHADRLQVPLLAAGKQQCLRQGERVKVAGRNVDGVRAYVTFSATPDGEARFGQRVTLQELTHAR